MSKYQMRDLLISLGGQIDPVDVVITDTMGADEVDILFATGAGCDGAPDGGSECAHPDTGETPCVECDPTICEQDDGAPSAPVDTSGPPQDCGRISRPPEWTGGCALPDTHIDCGPRTDCGDDATRLCRLPFVSAIDCIDTTCQPGGTEACEYPATDACVLFDTCPDVNVTATMCQPPLGGGAFGGVGSDPPPDCGQLEPDTCAVEDTKVDPTCSVNPGGPPHPRAALRQLLAALRRRSRR